QVQAIAARHGVLVANVFHAGDGNLHPAICYDERIPGQFETAMAANDAMLEACIAAGGAVTGEHGVGLDKAKKLARVFTDDDLAAMGAVRRVFDPKLLMNPDKVFPSPSACLEAKPGGRSRPVPEGMWI